MKLTCVAPLCAAAVLLVCSACTDGDDANGRQVQPGWQWTPERVSATVNAVRARRSLQPRAWPNGARVAVLLSFDVDNETIALRFHENTSL